MTYQTKTFPGGDGDTLVLDQAGRGGLPLLFIHGWTCRRDYWDEQMADLSRDRVVAALDLSGHGESAGNARCDWSVSGLADDVVTALSTMDGEEAVLVGHSMGGAVALEAAARVPEVVRGVILVDTFVLPYGDLSEDDAAGIETPFHEDFTAAVSDLVDQTAGPAMDDDTRARLKREMAAARTAWALPLWSDLLRWVPDTAFETVNCPIHAINGDLIPEPAKRRCAGRVTEWPMPGTGHFPQMEMPGAFNRRLRDVLETF